MRLALAYAVLALVATAVNIGTQDIVTRFYPGPFAILLAMVAGTGAGLVVKYVLDKRYIFRFRARDLGQDSRTFVLYTLMGLVTTAVFWGFELGFHYLFASREMRYAGAVIGLSIGYLAKYHLDKRYVFRTAESYSTGPAAPGQAVER